jgi:serine/threonine protein kinase
VEGISLKQCLDEARLLSEAEAISIARQALHILDHLHHHDPPIVHRDIRPGNILLQPNVPIRAAQVYLVDFGTVKSLATGNTSLTMVGTDGYLPPEQAAGRVLAKSDLYSLGATLAECLTGLPPVQMQSKGMRIQFQDHIDLSPEFAQWLQQLLATSLDHRWSSARVALEALNTSMV